MRRWLAVTAAVLAAGLAAAGRAPPGGADGDLGADGPPRAEAAAFVPTAGVCHATVVEAGYLANYQPVDCAETHMAQTAFVGRRRRSRSARGPTGRRSGAATRRPPRSWAATGAPPG